jgi:UTP--glucose-1-phosphate uridylyltransferase
MRPPITTAVICAAGKGTRLLPATKEQPKEMLPVFALSLAGVRTVKPLVQLVFEQLFDIGIRRFCFVIGRGKRSIADHFTQDRAFLSELKGTSGGQSMADLEEFYRRLDDSTLMWVNQPKPIGFGDAVLRAQRAVGDQPFIVHAGDTYIMSVGNSHLRRLIQAFRQEEPEAIFLLKKLPNVRDRGVVEGTRIKKNLFSVQRVVEKPEHPRSHLAIEPVYIFRPSIVDRLEKSEPGKDGEIQLTDGIQLLIQSGKKVLALSLQELDSRLDIGNPTSYWKALEQSFRKSQPTANTPQPRLTNTCLVDDS